MKTIVMAILIVCVTAPAVLANYLVMSSDVPRAIPDNQSVGITSTLEYPTMGILDVDLILNIDHTSIPDLHIELTSPSGTTAILISSYNENGILTDCGAADNFVNTYLDDDATVNLADGRAPWTGHFNINHPGNDLLSVFDGGNPCGTWTLFVSDLANEDVGTLQSWGLDLLTPAQTTVIMSSDVPRAIPDNQSAGITSTLEFSSMDILDVDLILNIDHTCIPDLHIELTSPSGTTAILISSYNENGILAGHGAPDNFVNTYLDDDATVNLADGRAPWMGHFNINHPGNDMLSIFDGEDAGGTWTLFVSDLANEDVGTLLSWGLEVTGPEAVVPEPAMISLLALGGLALLCRRRHGTT